VLRFWLAEQRFTGSSLYPCAAQESKLKEERERAQGALTQVESVQPQLAERAQLLDKLKAERDLVTFFTLFITLLF